MLQNNGIDRCLWGQDLPLLEELAFEQDLLLALWIWPGVSLHAFVRNFQFNLQQCSVGLSFQIMLEYTLSGWCIIYFYFGWMGQGTYLDFRLSVHRNRILQLSMNYSQSRKTCTSNNSPSWFQKDTMEGYKPPNTIFTPDFGNFDTKQKENMASTHIVKSQITVKGGFFQKASKVDIFIDKRKVPGPASYFKIPTQVSQNQVKNKIHQSSFFKKYPRFDQRKGKKSSYFQLPQQKTISIQKHKTLSQAQVIGYFDFARLKGTWTPGPGNYDPKMIRHKSLSQFSQAKKNSLTEIIKNNKKTIKKGIGPQTYMIPRSFSLVCSVKLKQPLKQSDEKIKQGISRMQIQKQKTSKAGPGKYLRIEEWSKYKNSKKIMNGFDICSKPVNKLKIYT